ncbi:MAG: amino acid adenylation domain-containing protein [Acidobacteriota bacterium]|nr:amino acid adenylation domain-containing protein [Acidobacteriota bacterium]
MSSPESVEVEVPATESLGEFRARVGRMFGDLRGPSRPVEGSRNPDFDVTVLDSPPEADYREDVVVYRAPEGVKALWRARLLDAATVQRFLSHVHAALTAPDEQSVDEVYLLSPEEESLLRGFESGGAPVGSPAPVHVQVIEQARRTPANPALKVNCRTVTYAELESRSAVVARALIKRGVRAGDSVALCVSAAAGVPALVGVLRAGAAVVPLDATFPQARLRSQLEQAGVRVALVENATRGAVPFEEVVSLDDLVWDGSTDGPAPDVPVTGESPAYVLFTSGSTGIPKGIKMPHRGLTNVVGWQVARSAPTPRTLQRTSLAFDVGMQEVFSTLCAGGCLVVADEDTRADPSKLPDFVAEHGIQRAFLPPVSLYQMAAALDSRPQPLPSLKEVYVAGEMLKIDPAVVRMFRSVEAILENQYGPTETHVATTFHLGDSPLRWPTRPPIGRPVPGVEVRILDSRGRRVPLGTAGEIIVRGRQVAHGYLLGVPFVAEDGTPAYATGDLGRWTAAGEIEFLGRQDRQVKVRGYRIELGEVETALQAQPGVRAAVVAALEDAGNARLAAWVVPEAGFPGLSTVRKRLLDVLPEHMVPALSAFATLEELPLTHTGKVNLSALKPPGEDEAEIRLNYVPSRNEVESVVAEIWRRELGLDRVGVHDDFLEIGGHSLLAIRIVSQLNERFGVSLPLRLLLRGGTVATIAKRLIDLNAIDQPEDELVRCPLPDGRVVLAPFAGEAQYLWEDVFEENSYGPPVIYAEDAVVVDVGANIGLYTLYALAAAPRGRVVAIEPVPLLFEALKRNTVEYAERVAYYLAAAGETDGTAPLTYYPKLSGMSSLRADPTADGTLLRRIVRNLIEQRAETDGLLKELDEMVSERLVSHTLSCPVRRIEGILDEAAPERIDVLKIDVQRYEEHVLRGVGGAWPRVKQVVVEVHDEGGALERIEGFLREQGFSTSARQQAIHAGTPVHFVVGQK